MHESLSLDKFPEIMGDFFRLCDGCQEFDFLKLTESLCNWADRNVRAMHNSEKYEKYKREHIF